jgi:hypothetical protein
MHCCELDDKNEGDSSVRDRFFLSYFLVFLGKLEGFRSLKKNTPNVTCFEHPSIEVEQFVAMLRFENRGKLAQLPQDLMDVHNGLSSSS